VIGFVSTCKGRAQHIRLTLPRNLSDNPGPDSKFILLDWNSGDDLIDYVRANFPMQIASGKLTVYSERTSPTFEMSRAKNCAMRCAILEGCDILVTVDADNFTGLNFEGFITDNLRGKGVFLCPDFPHIKSLPHGPDRPQRGYAGRLAIRAQEFIKMGGYDETFDVWRGEDIDIIARMQRVGHAMQTIPNHYLNAIPHGSDIRFKEYPHAKQYERQGEFATIYNRTETIVNNGKIGCGTVYRNFGKHPTEIKPLPTRIFGIGMHKTATTSLHEAFKILGYDSFHWETNRKSFRIWNEMNGLGRSPLLEQYYAACDLPIPMLYEKLDRAYPNSKFILTTREESGWLKSVEGLWNPKVNPWYDWDKQPYSHQIHKALYGRTDFDAHTFLERYRRHNAEVKEYFKGRDDLLVMDMDFGYPLEDDRAQWRTLCKFLEKPVPDVPYPRAYALY
jgi:hypothetical protein